MGLWCKEYKHIDDIYTLQDIVLSKHLRDLVLFIFMYFHNYGFWAYSMFFINYDNSAYNFSPSSSSSYTLSGLHVSLVAT